MKNALSKLWLTFAQAVTILFALFLVIRLYIPNFPNTIFQSEKAIVVAKSPTIEPSQPAVLSRDAVDSYSLAVNQAAPAVVNIFTSKHVQRDPHSQLLDDPFFRFFFGDKLDSLQSKKKPQNSLGSGVIVNPNGLIITNHHVIATADNIEVSMIDGRKLPASVVGTDPETDLALIKVNAAQLPAIRFAGLDNLAVGDVVLAIGNPFGVGQTVTQGIVSALGRNQLGINTFENFIQTDASINPGNSGGALINTHGELVGINSAIYSKSGGSMGIGFAIPASIAKQVLVQISENGNVTRGWVGIEVQDITPELAESFDLNTAQGAIIVRVLANGPAANAGIRAGDILTKINEKPVFNSGSMLNLIAGLTPNKPAKVTIQRAGETLVAELLIGTRPKSQ